MELILIKNALCSQSTEWELDPEVAEYAVSLPIWKKWSPQVRDRALKEFLLGNPPFQTVYDVSTNGLTYHRKVFGNLAAKPGTYRRKSRKHQSVVIKRIEAFSASKYY